MIDEDLRAWIVELLGEEEWNEKVQQNFSNESTGDPRIWYQRSGTTQDLMLSGASDIITTTFDLEVIADHIEDAADIAQEIKDEILGFRGNMGGGFGSGSGSGPVGSNVLLAEYEDHDENYIPQGLGDGDEGKHVSTLRLSIIHN